MDRVRRAVGANRATAAALGQRPTPAGPQTTARPAGPARHPVRAAHRDPVGVPAPRAGLRIRHDLLATAGRMERRRGMAAAPRGAVSRAERGRETGLVTPDPKP